MMAFSVTFLQSSHFLNLLCILIFNKKLCCMYYPPNAGGMQPDFTPVKIFSIYPANITLLSQNYHLENQSIHNTAAGRNVCIVLPAHLVKYSSSFDHHAVSSNNTDVLTPKFSLHMLHYHCY